MSDIMVQLTTVWTYVLPILTATFTAAVAAIGVSWLPWVVAAFALGKSINGPWGAQTGTHYGKAAAWAVVAFIVAAVVAGLWTRGM